MKYVDSKRFKVCEILTKEDIDKRLQNSKTFCKCEDNEKAKYEYYIDTETYKYFALKKEKEISFEDLASKFKFAGKILEHKKDIGYYINGEFITNSKKEIEECYDNLFERGCDI